MPRQRTHHSRRTYVFPDDFPQRLVRFKEESDLPWAEIARRLGTYPHTVKRWWKEGCGPTSGTRWRCWNWPTSWAWAICSPTGASGAKRGMGRPAPPGASAAPPGFSDRRRRRDARAQSERRRIGEAVATAGAETQKRRHTLACRGKDTAIRCPSPVSLGG